MEFAPPVSNGSRRPGLQPALGALFLLIIALAWLAPRLGAAGLWDPYEVRLLESAHAPVLAQSLLQSSTPRPRFLLLPLTLGIRYLGLSELGGRVPMLLLGLITLLALYGFAQWLTRTSAEPASSADPPGGAGPILSGLVLLSTPLFFLSARHVSVTLLPMLAHILAVFGLALLVCPHPARRIRDLLLGSVLSGLGLCAGFLGTGALLGVVAPLATLTVALALAEGPKPAQMICGALCGAALLPPLRLILASATVTTAERACLIGACLLTSGLSLLPWRSRKPSATWGLAAGALVLAVGLIPALSSEHFSGYTPFFGGILRWPTTRESQVDTLLRNIGFSFFPWVGFVPLAIVGLFHDPTAGKFGSAPAENGSAFARPLANLLPLTWFVVTYVLTTLHGALVGEISLPAFPALALLVGFYLARQFQRKTASGVAAAVCASLAMIMVGHDFFLTPEQYLNGHLLEALRWPEPLAYLGQVLTLCAIGIAAVFGIGLASPYIWRRRLLGLGIGLTLLAALCAIQGLAPMVARHVSYRGLYTHYQKLGGGALALYGVQQGSGHVYGQNSTHLYSVSEVMQFFLTSSGGRAFVIIPATELGAIDREARQRGQNYFIVDDSNAQFLLLCNRLLPGETDSNPLRRLISETAPHPQTPLHIVFEDKIELIGFDAPAEISRGSELKLRLYYRVLAPVPVSYRIFLHFDGMGTRWNGDHMPLEGKFPTSFWSPGIFVTDEHRISVSRLGQPAGYYQIFTGLWPGGEGARLRITEGPHESDQRVRIGVLKVK